MPTRLSFGSAALTALLAVVLTACSTITNGAPSSPTATLPISASSSSVSSGATSPTQSHLATLLLQPADLPPEATSLPDNTTPAPQATAAAFAACVGVRNTRPDLVAEARSPDFTLGNATYSSLAVSYRSQDDVNQDTAALRSAKAVACFKQDQRKPVGASIVTDDLTVTGPVAVDPPNLIAHVNAHIAISQGSQTIDFYVFANYLVGPFVLAEVYVTALGSPPDTRTLQGLVRLVAVRVAKG